MIEPWSETRLAQVLASVGEHLDIDPATATMPVAIAGRLRPSSSLRRWLAVAAALAALVVAATLAIAPVREAVADFLGIGSTSVEVVPEPEADPVGLPTIDEGLTDLSPSAAESRLRHALPDFGATPLGEPDRIASMPEGGVLVAWSDGATTLWIHEAMMPTEDLSLKLIDAGHDAEPLDGLGDAALTVTGEHILQTPFRRVRAGTVVLWTAADTEYRLESDLGLPAMLDIARALD
ncbi:MAG TPA: hypothetical protein VNO51_04775 [Ilumatobacteraceae bacterium]|nr:hypothetical protein [Ilumatobacteraceae bacterium]